MTLVSLARHARAISARAPTSNSLLCRTMSTSNTKYFILRYEYVPDILEKRGPFRAEHLQNAVDLKNQGKILMGGALLDPVDTGLFIFTTDDQSEIEAFAKNDPYVKNDLVTSYSIREWMVAV